MSKSQIKRLHEQHEAEKALKQDEHEEEEAPVQRKGPANRFAFFDDEDGAQSDENPEKSDDEPQNSAVEKKKSKKKTKKNNKKKGKGAEEEKEETEYQMLARLAALNLANKHVESAPGDAPNIEALMKIDIKHFDMSAELKRKLGKSFKEAISGGDDSNEPRWPPGKKAIGRIVKNKPNWFPANNCGLSMIKQKEEKGITWFVIRHNRAYEDRERTFWMAEQHMDINLIHELIHDTPYHLNSLLLLANSSRMSEDHNNAAGFIERGIFYVDQYAASTFEPFNWRHRMDYTDYENRAFYLLLHRHMLNAANKRCFETALNTAKLVFKLDPTRDPLAVMSIIDVFALRAKQYNWIVQMYEGTKKFKKLDLLPNWPYSVALAKFFLGKEEEAKVELQTAIRHFPSVVVQLMDLLQIHPDSAVMNCKMLTTFVADNERDSLKLLMKIYTKQTEEIWKQPEVLLFLEQATRAVALSRDEDELKECEDWKKKRNKMYHGRSPNVDRLAELIDVSPTTSLSNPVPPKVERCGYNRNPETAAANARGSQQGMMASFVNSLFPDPVDFQLDALAGFTERMRRFLTANTVETYNELTNWMRQADIRNEDGREVNPENQHEDPQANVLPDYVARALLQAFDDTEEARVLWPEDEASLAEVDRILAEDDAREAAQAQQGAAGAPEAAGAAEEEQGAERPQEEEEEGERRQE